MPLLFELLHEARLGVARRRLRLVAHRPQLFERDPLALDHRRQPRLALGRLFVVDVFDVRAPEPEELVRLARRAQHRPLAGARLRADLQGDAQRAGVGHLARDRADPDQLVEGALVGVELRAHGLGRTDVFARGPDRLVRLLRVLHLACGRCAAPRGGTRCRSARRSGGGPRRPPAPTGWCCRYACR